MGNAIDKTVRALSPTTWFDGITDNKTYYDCPECGREVYAYGSMAGTKCLGCPGRSYKSSHKKQIDNLNSQVTSLSNKVSSQQSTITTYETAEDNMKTNQKKARESLQEKKDVLEPKLDNIKNKYTSTSDQKEDPTINMQDLDADNNELDQWLQDIKSATDKTEEYIKFTQDLEKQASEVPTYEDEQEVAKQTAAIREAQQKLMDSRKTAVQKQEKILERQNELSQKGMDLAEKAMAARNREADINKDSVKMDELRLELNAVTGAEMNADPDTFNDMKNKFDDLCKLLRTKHSDNQKVIAQLEACQNRVEEMKQKLIIQDLNNKYLIQLIDAEYKNLRDAVNDVMQKFEERGKYFLAVTCGLKEDIIKKLEDLIGEEHDMDMIVEIEEKDLKEIGIHKLIIKKILSKIKKIKVNE
eukprot:CAMPEP_0201574834 /NCGR_PEP_ID=MMETSP0190_2-20130828/19580_1 /ASSEMBLY_ACC=CAM_ASM_000263 /TAXON_ID=37353 /ORGANISM="Rosalina sp." /LENGTH=414 /DNA_ID=CAMNT_0048003635 /DNA_START=62 /DNA_END=1309 /DNA_ORIENTATION=-